MHGVVAGGPEGLVNATQHEIKEKTYTGIILLAFQGEPYISVV